MGIYIKGMEMPEGTQTKVVVLLGKIARVNGKDYPVISVPPQGRLIDADTLPISTAVPPDGKPYRYVHIDNIENASTIIQTEKERNDEIHKTR